jgi:hypothetical protein
VARPGRSGHGFRSGILLAKILHNIWRKMLYQKFGYEAVIVAWPSRQRGHCFRAAVGTCPSWLKEICSDCFRCGCCGVARPGRSGHGFRSGILLAKILHNIWRKMLYHKFGYEAVIVAWPSRQRGHCFLAADETWLS